MFLLFLIVLGAACITAGCADQRDSSLRTKEAPLAFDAHPTYSLHHLAHPGLDQAVQRFLEQERQQAHRTIEHMAGA